MCYTRKILTVLNFNKVKHDILLCHKFLNDGELYWSFSGLRSYDLAGRLIYGHYGCMCVSQLGLYYPSCFPESLHSAQHNCGIGINKSQASNEAVLAAVGAPKARFTLSPSVVVEKRQYRREGIRVHVQ